MVRTPDIMHRIGLANLIRTHTAVNGRYTIHHTLASSLSGKIQNLGTIFLPNALVDELLFGGPGPVAIGGGRGGGGMEDFADCAGEIGGGLA